ncbi:hypothetical protein C8A03DRAFT_19566 [Achaetomium macrosporum]|uniref:GST N-terminal domain-containing protein n=1 Tax=Achaetomium macrosporum TaxID=79813 RepID=A0AAN7C1I3_9PEZI|nr:hypothetical protein C8A03DRAFT_19566 [Achaetomium macrosporum]
MAEPAGLVAKSGIEFLSAGTPNGHKVSVLLEELKEAYGKDYSVQSINIFDNDKKTQKQPWYTALNPKGRIPTIVDHDRRGFAVFETAKAQMSGDLVKYFTQSTLLCDRYA